MQIEYLITGVCEQLIHQLYEGVHSWSIGC